MKYLEIDGIHCGTGYETMRLKLGCSQCGLDVGPLDAYCRGCGRKLTPLEPQLKMKEVLAMINTHLRKERT